MRVLVVEDEMKVANALREGLEGEKFEVIVERTGEGAFFRVNTESFDVILLDLTLPGRDGLEILQALRQRGVKTPVLVLTARDSLQDRVTGLDSGADDYLIKPFAFAELLARIRALLRRSRSAQPAVLRIGDLTLDPGSRRVTRAGVAITLTSKEFAILEVLMRSAGDIVSRTRLVERVWDEASEVLDNLVDVHLSHLRKKIDSGERAPLIHTIRGFGYRLGPQSTDA
jgi:DNA-binding response OmpR family regulator